MAIKRFKVWMNGIQRNDELLEEKDIVNKLRQKWITSAVSNTEEIKINIFPKNKELNNSSSWKVNYSKPHPIITLNDSNSKKQVFDLNIIIASESLELFEIFLEQAKLMFLTTHKDYECAWGHLINKIKHEKHKLKSIIGDIK